MTKPAAPAPGGGDITLVAAAKQHGMAVSSLRALAMSDRVRYRSLRQWGRGTSITFDDAELNADLDRLPPCLAAGCQAPGTGQSGYCGEHFGQGGRERANKAERDLLADDANHVRDWYTAHEAADAAGCSPTMIHSEHRAAELPGEKVGRHLRIPKAALHEWAKSLVGRTVGVKKPTDAQTQGPPPASQGPPPERLEARQDSRAPRLLEEHSPQRSRRAGARA